MHEARAAMRAVAVQRADAEAGPYGTLTAVGLEPSLEMSYQDDGVRPQHSYWYRLSLVLADGSMRFSPSVLAVAGRTSRTVLRSVRHGDGGVEIRYSIAATSRVDLRLYDVRGRLVRTLAREPMHAGEYLRTWDGKTVWPTRRVLADRDSSPAPPFARESIGP